MNGIKYTEKIEHEGLEALIGSLYKIRYAHIERI